MLKRLLILLLLVFAFFLQSCSNIIPATPDVSGVAGIDTIPPIRIVSPNPDPSSQEIGAD